MTSETISQQAICGESENIEIVNDTEPKLTQNKEQIEIEQTRKNLVNAWEVYFKYLSSQRMAHTKSSARQRAMDGGNVIVPTQSSNQPSTQPEKQRAPHFGKTIKKIIKSKVQ